MAILLKHITGLAHESVTLSTCVCSSFLCHLLAQKKKCVEKPILKIFPMAGVTGLSVVSSYGHQ